MRRNYLLKCEVAMKATHKAHTVQQPEEWQDWESITSSSLEEKEEGAIVRFQREKGGKGEEKRKGEEERGSTVE